MAKPVTKRYGSAAKARAAVKGGGSNNALRRLKAEETVKVRFLQEPEDWHEAWYHYVDKFSWCSQVRSCPGCSVGNRARKIVLANAVIMHSDRDGEAGKVVVMQMPTTLADQVLKRHERFGTVLDRDYDLSREGATQNDTKYSVDYDEKKRRDLSRWEDKIHDITAIVSSELSQSGEDEDSDEDDEGEPRSTKKSSSKNRSYDEDEDDFEDDEDEEEEAAEDDFSELDRTELKREIKKLDPDFVAKKSQSDEDLREILRDLSSSEDDDEDFEDDEDEEEEPPRRPSKKSKYDGLNEFKAKPAAKKTTVRAVRRSR